MTIEEKLRTSSRELLDLTARNRLINTPRTRAKSTSIEIVNADANEIFDRLVRDRKSMTFAAGRETEADETEEVDESPYHLDQPEEDEIQVPNGEGRRRADTFQTRLTSEVLQRRLLRLFLDARTYEEEQGVNILFLAIGFLKWYEAPNSDQPRYAPLLLIPVKLDRQSSRSKFKIAALEEDISTNLSLKARLSELNVEFPEIPEVDDDQLSLDEYFELVRKSIAGEKRWEVLPNDMVLWFFSFTKFLMYRDLQGENWPEGQSLADHGSVRGLLGEGFRAEAPLCGDDDPVEPVCPPEQAIHIVDADSSQALAIEEVRRGRHLVIQGPPGTGKSQTIANLIATAVKEGKKVLFVAEKMAALEVVKSRLDRCGLGALCLELHSNKAIKKAVLLNLSETLEVRRPKLGDLDEQLEELRRTREQLNQHADTLHSPFGGARYTPYFVIGQLVRLAGSGVPPAAFRLNGATKWTDRQIKDKAAIVHDAAIHLSKIGVPAKHPWKGVNAEALLPTERQRILEKISPIIARIDRLLQSTVKLAKSLSYRLFPSPAQITTLSRLGTHLAEAPDADAAAVADEIWNSSREMIGGLLEQGQIYSDRRQRLSGILEEEAWQSNVGPIRKQLSLHGGSWFRWLSGKYRKAVRELETLCVERPPQRVKERIELLDLLIAGQRARKQIEDDGNSDRVGNRAFGSRWHGLDSDWTKLAAVPMWVAAGEEKNLPSTFRQLLDAAQNSGECGKYAQRINAELAPLLNELTSLFAELRLDLPEAFGTADSNSLSVVVLKERLELWLQHPNALETWIAFRTRWRRLLAEQLDELATLIDNGTVTAASAVDQFLMATYEEIMRAVYRHFPNLAEFDGQSHEEIVARFQQLDRKRIDLARREVAMSHYQTLPRGESDIGEMAIVRHEIQKKSRHLPIRRLVAKAGRAIQAIKPVFMMSPLSIAQFLEPGAVEFDLLLIDEASQVRPVDALGAIGRCKQIVVVGDDKQLPPTTFFEKLTGNVEVGESEDDDQQTGDLESVLGLCLARNITPRMLRWHYRSRHHTLIAVSNHEFYNDRLHIVPNPDREPAEMGLRFRHVANGVFDRGKSATNRNEARAVALAMVEHARKYPKQSLGVGTFSVAQRNAVRDELELLLRENPDVDRFFSTSDGEPYFIKNLESLQGDERDVIFISIGYARDESGFFAMSFGPLATAGGERRLNVLISRARIRCEVFSSIVAEDIDLNRARSRGAAALKTFLKYAQSGILDVGVPTDRESDSDFELEVKRCLEQNGYEVDTQVGVAGFFIDLAVRDPAQPGRYLLGVECDGATYHSSRSARDRDRLRQQVLEDRQWAIHRIWSTDWYKNSDEQLKRTLAAIENAMRRKLCKPTVPPTAANEGEEVEDASDDDTEGEFDVPIDDPLLRIVTEYKEAELRARTDQPLHEVPIAGLAQVAVHVVQVEAPVHRDEVTRRIASFWGQQRVSARMSAAVERALVYAVRQGTLEDRDDFYCLRGQQDVPVRNRESVLSTTLRNPEMLPPEEIRKAVLHIVQTHLGAANDEIIATASRVFGFRSAGPKIRQVIGEIVIDLLASGTLREREDRLYAS
jgi:Superfamily I DNA and RNA helicases and helicase subunits